MPAECHLDDDSALVYYKDTTLEPPSTALWIPEEEHQLQLRYMIIAHAKEGRHASMAATMDILTRIAWWPSMSDDVAQFCRECIHCVKGAGNTVIPRPLGYTLQASRPNQVLHMDYLEGDSTSDGFKYMLVLKDGFTRFTRIFACQTEDAATTAFVIRTWCRAYAAPQWVVSDRGSHFKAEVLKHLAETYGYRHLFTWAACPWANGSVENMNGQITRVLRVMFSQCCATTDDYMWHALLPAVEQRLNDTAGQGQRYTPRECFLNPSTGRRRPIDDDLATAALEAPSDAEIDPDFQPFIEAWEDLHRQQVRVNANLHNKASKRRAKAHHQNTPCFLPGDWVLVARRSHKTGEKLTCKWMGPCKIINPCDNSEHAYTVEDAHTKSQSIVHIRRLRFYCEQHRSTEADMAAIAASTSTLYEVHDLIEFRYGGSPKQARMRVQWKGWETEDDTWTLCSVLAKDVPKLFSDALLKLREEVPQNFLQHAREWLTTQQQKAYLDSLFNPRIRPSVRITAAPSTRITPTSTSLGVATD
eukprot:GHVU01145438.1.p1 GENE.GHVU01145438.1~~GHVU01145438.1.p1  ORF type:complete len:557 (-),score=70.77 GHVU01145438.1:169-1758(-)